MRRFIWNTKFVLNILSVIAVNANISPTFTTPLFFRNSTFIVTEVWKKVIFCKQALSKAIWAAKKISKKIFFFFFKIEPIVASNFLIKTADDCEL